MAFAFYSEKYGDHVNAHQNSVKINFKEIEKVDNNLKLRVRTLNLS